MRAVTNARNSHCVRTRSGTSSAPPPSEQHTPTAGVVKPRAKRILIVDDEPTLLDILVEHFIDTHYEVETAANGVEALTAVVRERPDLVLLDVRMPRMGGIEVLKEIVKIDRSITVIMVTGNSDLTVTVEALRNGAFGYVPKPFDFRYLLHLIAASIGG